jgi:zinc transporter
MAETAAIIHCLQLDGNGGAVPVDIAGVKADDARMIWLHLNGKSPETKRIIKDHLRIDALVAKAMLAEETRPRLEEIEGKSLLILRGVNFNPGPEPEDLVSVRLWISDHLVVSVGRRKSRAVAEVMQRLNEKHGPKKSGEFVSMLCSALNDAFEPALHELEARTDAFEDLPLDSASSSLRDDLAHLRKQATMFRRHLSPQRDVIHRLYRSEQPWLGPSDVWLLQESHDRSTRFIENLDTIRERTQIIQDELYSALSARLNKSIYMLSIISAVFMPLTLVTGLLGMNVAGIPGAESPKAFAIVCLSLLSLAFFILDALKRLRSI